MKPIRLDVGGVVLYGEIDDSPLAEQVWQLLPFGCSGETWGEEIYFPVALEADNPTPVEKVAVGDIAYWPDGPDLCLFFGRTPKSTGPEPVVASPVTVVGRFACDPAAFRLIMRDRHGVPVRVARDAESAAREPTGSTETGQ